MSNNIYDLNMSNENTNYFRNFIPRDRVSERKRRRRRRKGNINLKQIHKEKIIRKLIKYPTFCFVETLPILKNKIYIIYEKNNYYNNYYNHAFNNITEHISTLEKYLETVNTKEDYFSTIKVIKYFQDEINRIKNIQQKKQFILKKIKEEKNIYYNNMTREQLIQKHFPTHTTTEKYVEEEKEELEEKYPESEDDELSKCWDSKKIKEAIKLSIMTNNVDMERRKYNYHYQTLGRIDIEKAIKISIMTNNVDMTRRKNNYPTLGRSEIKEDELEKWKYECNELIKQKNPCRKLIEKRKDLNKTFKHLINNEPARKIFCKKFNYVNSIIRNKYGYKKCKV